MKSYHEVFSAVALMFVFATIFSCRTALRLRFCAYDDATYPPPIQPPQQQLWNATLVQLANKETGEPDGMTEANEFISNVDSSSTIGRLPPLSFIKEHGNKIDGSKLVIIRSNAARDIQMLPSFRQAIHERSRTQYSGPGIMSELPSLLKDLHHGSRFASCAVVGNSGILLRREHGALIDRHDLVIRLNNARTSGYEAHVGSKTGLAFMNSNVLHQCRYRKGCSCHRYGEDVPIMMYICQAVHFFDYAKCRASRNAPLLVTDARLDGLCAKILKYYSLKRFVNETGRAPEEWKEAHDAEMFHYSSGMQAVVLAVGVCDRVSLFGFGKMPGAKHHYHTSQATELDLHDYKAEYEFYRDLADRPQAIPFLADEPEFKVPPVVVYP